MHKYILKIAKWVNGTLKNHKVKYGSYDDALLESKKHHGYIKIYEDEKLIHAEKKLIEDLEKTIQDDFYA